jgi:hypothetical protein
MKFLISPQSKSNWHNKDTIKHRKRKRRLENYKALNLPSNQTVQASVRIQEKASRFLIIQIVNSRLSKGLRICLSKATISK